MTNLSIVSDLYQGMEYDDAAGAGSVNQNEIELRTEIEKPAPSGQKRKRYVSKAW